MGFVTSAKNTMNQSKESPKQPILLSSSTNAPKKHQTKISSAAIFAAKPLEHPLELWMQELDIASTIELFPYNRVFQKLLDSNSDIYVDRARIDVILVNFEDWQKYSFNIQRNIYNLAIALRSRAKTTATYHLICFYPTSLDSIEDIDRINFLKQMKIWLAFELEQLNLALDLGFSLNFNFCRYSSSSLLIKLKLFVNDIEI
jgi:hypothetical protein